MNMDFETALPLDDDLWRQFLTDDVPTLSDSSSPATTPTTSQPLSPASSPQYEQGQQVITDTTYLEAQLFAQDDLAPDMINALACNDIMDIINDLSPEVIQQQASSLLDEISFNDDLLSDLSAQVSPLATVPEMKLEMSSSGSSSSDSDSKEREKRTKNTKKRRNAAEPLPTTPGNLQEDELVKLNRSQLEATTKQLQASGAMTPEEIKELKKRRRLLKNREYAQLSRHRKRAHVDELEGKLQAQIDCNQELATKNTELMLENQQLRLKTSRLQKMLQQSAVIASFLKNFSVASKKNSTITPTASAAGVCLMVLLLSFGVFFNQDAVHTQTSAPTPLTRSSPLPADIPKGYTGRNILMKHQPEYVTHPTQFGTDEVLQCGLRQFGSDSKLHFGMIYWDNATTPVTAKPEWWQGAQVNTTTSYEWPQQTTTTVLFIAQVST